VAEFSRALERGADADATASAPRPSRAPQDAPTMSRTALNPVLGHGRGQPDGAAAHPTAKDFTAAATAVRPPPPEAARRKLPRFDRRAVAIALALSALAGGAVILTSGTVQWAAPPAVPPRALAPQAAAQVERVAVAPVPAPPEPAASAVPPPPAAVATVEPRTLAIVPLGSDGHFKPGERIGLQVIASQDAHVYCYLQDEAQRIVRFYPNRFRKSALVTAAAPLDIPGPMGFEILANTRNVPETIACFASAVDLMDRLPPEVVGTDFARLPVTSLDEVRSAFARVGADNLAEARFQVQFK
jgi:hypothetical protein